MPKAPKADLDDVNKAKAEVEAEVKALSARLDKFEKASKEIESRVGGMAAKTEAARDLIMADADAAIQEVAADLRGEISAAAADLREQIQAFRPLVEDSILGARQDLERKVGEADAETRSAFAQELSGVCERFDQELTASQGSTEATIAQRAAEAAQGLQQQRAELEAVLAEARQEAAAGVAEARRDGSEDLARAADAQKAEVKRLESSAAAARDEMQRGLQDIESQVEEATTNLSKVAATSREEVNRSLAEADTKLSKAVEELFEKLSEGMAEAKQTISDVENVPTRKVEWIIKNASRRVQAPIPDEGPVGKSFSWRSPRFDAAGARDLQLEIRVWRPADPVPEGQGKGDCAVFLRAGKGTNIAFRLSIGSGHQACSQAFEKRFCSEHDVVGTTRLCGWKDQIDGVTDELRIGCEVFESVYDFQTPIEQPQEEKDIPREDFTLGDGKETLEGALRRHRIVNNRLLQQVRSQVEHIKAHMVKRVEWRIEQASLLRRGFPRGAPVRSKEFDAAGILGMQLIFYPSGYDAATEGFCSLYLSAPAGATLSCCLYAGKERRDVNYTFETAGQFGRANFCRFEACINADDDSVLLALDIDDAVQDIAAKVGHFPPPGAGIRSLADEGAAPNGAPFGSVVKLQRRNNAPAALQEVKMLPSLWGGKNTQDQAVSPAVHHPGQKGLSNPRRRVRERSAPALHTL